jgi:CheY-like chemotaxis protein
MIPCCFHPTTVLVIDDQSEFLEGLNLVLSQDQAIYKFFTNPKKALDVLKSHIPNPFPSRYIQNVDEEQWEHRRLDVNIFDIYKEIYRPQRFEEISTIVVDYSMPEMTGLELCKKIAHLPLQKILLTGEADEQIAIQAFNEGLIQHYIRKHDRNMADQLNQAIIKAQWRYFNKLSEVALQAIAGVDVIDHAVLDSNFHSLFNQLMKEHRLKEAYLCETMGSYLFLTEEAKAYGLVVSIAEELDICADIGEAHNISPSLLKQLRDRKMMMCYHDRQRLSDLTPADWEKYAYPVKTLEGVNRTYYHAFAPNIFQIDQSKVISIENMQGGKSFEIQ